jgi:Polyketide cyclase / dehydrase and lipid transport
MAHVVTDLDTSASPERVMDALTDFSERRLELWPNIDRKYFAVNARGDHSAEVTEGSPVFGGVWERGRYDWSHPGTVRLDVHDSNAFKPGSFWIYEVTPGANGGSHVHMEFERRPRNLKGVFVGALLSLFGKKIFGKSLRDTLNRIERSASR